MLSYFETITSEEEEEETEESVESSSSFATEVESDDSDVVGSKRRRSSRWENLPLRRSARNRRGGDDYGKGSSTSFSPFLSVC